MFYAPRIRLDTEFIKHRELKHFLISIEIINVRKSKYNEFVLLYYKFMIQLIYSCIFLSHVRFEDAGCSYPEI
jgi:hypothetical protein